jgi:hypothetical protein
MQLAEAIAAIDSLANGIDPVTGQRLPESGPYQHPRVIRGLFTVLEQARRASEGHTPTRHTSGSLARASGLCERTGKPWTPAEDEQLIAEFYAAVDFKAMAKMHGRTRGAIVSRLTELGKIKPKHGDPAPDMEPDFERHSGPGLRSSSRCPSGTGRRGVIA